MLISLGNMAMTTLRELGVGLGAAAGGGVLSERLLDSPQPLNPTANALSARNKVRIRVGCMADSKARRLKSEAPYREARPTSTRHVFSLEAGAVEDNLPKR